MVDLRKPCSDHLNSEGNMANAIWKHRMGPELDLVHDIELGLFVNIYGPEKMTFQYNGFLFRF